MLLFSFFDGENASAKASELSQFLLDRLKPFLPLAVSSVSLRFISPPTSILVVQLLNLSDFGAQAADLVAKHFEVIHTIKNNLSRTIRRRDPCWRFADKGLSAYLILRSG
jgi:hypothetical protein